MQGVKRGTGVLPLPRRLETVNLPMIESAGNMVKQAMARGRMG